MATKGAFADGLRKVPEITAQFWAIKLLTTAMGESLSDYLVVTINPFIAVALGTLALVAAFALQFRSRRYKAGIYWFTVSMVAVFGTMAADVLHVGFGIAYWVSSVFFAICLAAVFIVWKRVEGTLSIHSITTPHRETFYWMTVLATFALGTAAGDMSATTLRLGYFGSIALFFIVILVPVILRFGLKWSEVFTFWFAYVLTRPVGASVADWLGVPKSVGGVGVGHGPVSVVLIIAIVIWVGILGHKEARARRHEPTGPA